MIVCPKCAGSQIGGPTYNALLDMLDYRCLRCGYTEQAEPRDRQTARAAMEQRLRKPEPR